MLIGFSAKVSMYSFFKKVLCIFWFQRDGLIQQIRSEQVRKNLSSELETIYKLTYVKKSSPSALLIWHVQSIDMHNVSGCH